MYIGDQNNTLGRTLENDFTEAERLVREFGNSGEKIVFFVDPQPPITEFTYVNKEVEKEVYNYETGEIETITTLELEKVPTSEVAISSYDRQTANTKVCKRGNQCDINGEITLINPVTGLPVDPPYGFLMSIKCETSTDSVINCQNFTTRTENILTHDENVFSYTFTTNQNDPTGIYLATVSITSKFKELNPETQLTEFIRRDGVLRVEIVA